MKKYILVLLLISAIITVSNATAFEDTYVLKNEANIERSPGISFMMERYAMQTEKLERVDEIMGKIHPVFAGVAYAGFWGLMGTGVALTAISMIDPAHVAYVPLQVAQLGIAVPTILSFATMLGLGYTKIGLKAKLGEELRKKHFIASCLTLVCYVLELTTLIVSSLFHYRNHAGSPWAGLAHNITGALTLTAFTVSMITIFF